MNKKIDDYKSALDYLYSFVDFSLTRNFRYSAEKFNLDRMRALMELIGNPQNDYPIVHVAGTKGKGSMCAMLTSVLCKAGYKTGLYTSPHLQDYTERIRVDEKEIIKSELISLINEMKPNIAVIDGLTTFEITTAIAFLFFSRKNVDIAIIEVGLGGRLDATNIVHPTTCILSTISKDHEKILGNTLVKIAKEKAGIIKDQVPVVIAPQKPRVDVVFKNIALQKNAPVIIVKNTYKLIYGTHCIKGQYFSIINKEFHKRINLFTKLLGRHQATNALSVYAALQVLNRKGFSISNVAIEEGFRNVKWPGRFEIISYKPLIIIDSAHNTDSIQKLVQTIEDYFPQKKVILVFGASEDKNIRSMLKILLPNCQKIIFSNSDHPRALDPEKLKAVGRTFTNDIEVISPMGNALEKAITFYDQDSIIIVTGSIFVAAAASAIWKRRK